MWFIHSLPTPPPPFHCLFISSSIWRRKLFKGCVFRVFHLFAPLFLFFICKDERWELIVEAWWVPSPVHLNVNFMWTKFSWSHPPWLFVNFGFNWLSSLLCVSHRNYLSRFGVLCAWGAVCLVFCVFRLFAALCSYLFVRAGVHPWTKRNTIACWTQCQL